MTEKKDIKVEDVKPQADHQKEPGNNNRQKSQMLKKSNGECEYLKGAIFENEW